MSKSRILPALALLLVALPGAAQPPSSQALLRVHAALTVFAQGPELVDEDLFVHGDGLATGSLALSREGACASCYWSTAIVQGSGSSEQFAALQAALGVNKVGVQAGGCVVQSVMPGTGTYEVTWYGRGSRRNSWLVQVGGEGEPCAVEVSNIIRAIETYSSQAHVPTSELWSPF